MPGLSKWVIAGAVSGAVFTAFSSTAQDFVPQGGQVIWNRKAPKMAMIIVSDAPPLTQVPNGSLASLFQIDPSYARPATVKVVGAFEIGETSDFRLTGAASDSFLPVTLSLFNNGRCFRFTADYNNGALSNGQLKSDFCQLPKTHYSTPAPPPGSQPLRLVGDKVGYAAWTDDKAGMTYITAPYNDRFAPFVMTRMPVIAIGAGNSIDAPLGNVTLVGRIDGRLMIVTLEVSWDRNDWGLPKRK